MVESYKDTDICSKNLKIGESFGFIGASAICDLRGL